MTSATEELRRLLDERGVEWVYEGGTVSFADRGRWYNAWAYSDGTMAVSMGYLTPEQVIAATLVGGTLTAEQVRKAIFDASAYASYDGAKYYADGISMQAITDDLNSLLGGGTCHCKTPDDAWCFACSACGKSFPRNEMHLAHNHGEINYCPNCGRRVIDDRQGD